jgi:uncharacterized protein (DUF1778 family)
MPRDENLDIRVNPDEKAAIQAAAKREGRTVSEWARLLMLRSAKRRTRAETKNVPEDDHRRDQRVVPVPENPGS